MPTPLADTLADITKDRRRKLTIPSSNLRSHAKYGTGYGRSEDILRTIPGASDEEAFNVLGADYRRGQMAPSLRPIAQVGVDSDMPTITGADYRQRNDILEAIRPPADLDPGNVGRAMRSADPLAELRTTATAMGRDPRDVLANLRNTEGMTEQAKARYRQRNEDIAITDRRQRAAAGDVLGQITAKGDADAKVEKVKGEAQMGVEGAKGEQARKQMEADRMDALIREKLGIPKTAEWDAKLKELQDAWQSGVNAGQYGTAGREGGGSGSKDRVQQLLEDLKTPPGAQPATPSTIVPAPLRQAGQFATGGAGSSGLPGGTLNLDMGQPRQPAAPADPDEGKVVTQGGRRHVKRNGQWVEG